MIWTNFMMFAFFQKERFQIKNKDGHENHSSTFIILSILHRWTTLSLQYHLLEVVQTWKLFLGYWAKFYETLKWRHKSPHATKQIFDSTKRLLSHYKKRKKMRIEVIPGFSIQIPLLALPWHPEINQNKWETWNPNVICILRHYSTHKFDSYCLHSCMDGTDTLIEFQNIHLNGSLLWNWIGSRCKILLIWMKKEKGTWRKITFNLCLNIELLFQDIYKKKFFGNSCERKYGQNWDGNTAPLSFISFSSFTSLFALFAFCAFSKVKFNVSAVNELEKIRNKGRYK